MQRLTLNVVAALRAVPKDYLENDSHNVLFSALYNMTEKRKWERSARFKLRQAGLPTRTSPYREQKRGKVASHFEVTAATKKGPLNSNFGFF